jgi:hypothetical protein
MKRSDLMPRESVRNKPPKGKQTCTACGKEKNLVDFYASNSQMFSSSGRVPICKSCIKDKSLDDNGAINLDKFHNILRQIDKPFLLNLFQSACDEAQKSEIEGTGRTDILGIYFKNIQSLPQNKNLTYADSEVYNKQNPINKYAVAKMNSGASGISNTTIYNGEVIGKPDEALIYSKRWRGNYTQTDLDYLENYYNGLDRDYKISTENHRDYARKIAKASLQMDKCFEDMMAGVSGADTRYKNARETFDNLCKSAKFSESTRSLNDVGLSSFSIITDRVEAHNWIPEHIPIEKDEIDKMLEYLSTINKSV